MSICSLSGISVKFCRRAYILAHTRVFSPPGIALAHYSSENTLFLMVKKRSLEARTKLQAKKFPNHHPCVSKTSSDPNTNNPSYQFTPSPSNPQTYGNKCESMKSQHTPKSEKPKTKVCQNTEVLRAANCNSSQDRKRLRIQQTGTACTGGGGPTGGGADGGGSKGPKCDDKNLGASPDSDKNLKLLLGLLAALGAGGLLYWLLAKGKGKQTDLPDCKQPDLLPQRVPLNSADLPKHVPYLLIGSGAASFSAFRAIKSNDPKAKVLMITDEFRKPYMRPPLSKELWYSAAQQEVTKEYRFKQWTGAERSLYFEPAEFFVDPTKLLETVNGGIAVAQGYSVKKVDPFNRTVTLSDGCEIGYDECLIATGCTPKNLPVFANASLNVREKVMVYRTPDDFERLKRYVDEKKSITIVGNGFIGSELACSLANYSKNKGVKINQVFQESGNMSKVLPDYLSKWTTKKVEAQGVYVLPNAKVRQVQRDESMLKLTLNNGSTLLTDIVVVCVGCEPNTSIANLSGLEVDRTLGGFLVNAELEARRNLFVAGDASCFYDPLLGRRRVEHHDHSVVSGRLAGENMVGKKKAYTHQSMFWSDLGPDIGYEGIGLIDAALPTVGVFALPTKTDRRTDILTEIETEKEGNCPKEPEKQELPDVKCDIKDCENYGRGVIFYLRDDKIVGILLWNLFNRIGLARTIINQNRKYDDLNEVAKLFEIHS